MSLCLDGFLLGCLPGGVCLCLSSFDVLSVLPGSTFRQPLPGIPGMFFLLLCSRRCLCHYLAVMIWLVLTTYSH